MQANEKSAPMSPWHPTATQSRRQSQRYCNTKKKPQYSARRKNTERKQTKPSHESALLREITRSSFLEACFLIAKVFLNTDYITVQQVYFI